MLNKKVFTNIIQSQKQILLVTKYWDSKTTKKIWNEAKDAYLECIFWLWENRLESLQEKNLPRESLHFIWNIQSQKIRSIVESCSVIHSLSSIKHAQKIENIWISVEAFVQVRLDENKNIGVLPSDLSDFLDACKEYKHLKIVWISGMWSAEFSADKKRAEFQLLVSLRNTYLPNGLISAGTSRDYEIALEEWIDVVRVGKSILAE